MNTFKKLTLSLALSSALLSSAIAQNPDYEAGQKAMHSQNYQKAYENFKKSQADKEYQESSMYWQAYSLFKLRQNSKAKKLIKQLLKKFPKGRWSDNAQVLLFENSRPHERKEMVERPERPERPEPAERPERAERAEMAELSEDLRLYAIQEMYFQNPEKGLAQVQELIEKSDDLNTKLNALQLLGISESDKAQKYLYEFALKNKNQELNEVAIQMLSLRGNKQSTEMLAKLYGKVDNKHSKISIIQSFIHSENAEKLVEMMKNEKDVELNNQMIQLLGIFGAKEQLSQLTDKLTGLESRRALMQALAISGDSQSLKKMIENSKDTELKIEAIESLAIVDDLELQDYLVELYPKEVEIEIKRALTNAFIVNEVEVQKIVELIKTEKVIESKRDLLNSLMAMGEEADLVELYELENELEVKEEILNILGAHGESSQVMQIYEKMPDIETKINALHAIALDGGEDSKKFLIQSYEDGNNEIKRAVIESFIIQDSAMALAELLKTEDDYELKKKLIQAISMTGSDELLEKLIN